MSLFHYCYSSYFFVTTTVVMAMYIKSYDVRTFKISQYCYSSDIIENLFKMKTIIYILIQSPFY